MLLLFYLGKAASGGRTKTCQPSEAKIDSTPARTRPLQPNQLDVDRTGSGASLKDFCQTTIGRTVVSLSELRDRLLRHQSSLTKDNPMRSVGLVGGVVSYYFIQKSGRV